MDGPSDRELPIVSEDSNEMQNGLIAFKEGNWEDAVQHIGQALQARIEASGDEADECADLYYHYGAALFYRAQEESDVFGAPLESTVTADSVRPSNDTRPGSEAAPSNDPGPSSSSAHQRPSTEGSAEKAEEDGSDDEGEEGEEEADDDMQLAWENLEVAKTIYERNKELHTDRLADIHALLADLAMEQENFETALADYKSAFEIVAASTSAEDQAQDRKLAELHFKIGLVLHFLQKPEEALNEVDAAAAICTKCLQASDAAGGGPMPDSGLQSVLEDIKAKQEELKQAVDEMQKQKETIQAALKKAFGSVAGASGSTVAGSSGQAQASKVMDLGVVGQGRRRINLAPVQANPGATSAAGDAKLQTNGQPKPKRSLEDLMGGAPTTASGIASQQPLTEGQKRARAEPHASKRADVDQKPPGKENVAQITAEPAKEPKQAAGNAE